MYETVRGDIFDGSVRYNNRTMDLFREKNFYESLEKDIEKIKTNRENKNSELYLNLTKYDGLIQVAEEKRPTLVPIYKLFKRMYLHEYSKTRLAQFELIKFGMDKLEAGAGELNSIVRGAPYDDTRKLRQNLQDQTAFIFEVDELRDFAKSVVAIYSSLSDEDFVIQDQSIDEEEFESVNTNVDKVKNLRQVSEYLEDISKGIRKWVDTIGKDKKKIYDRLRREHGHVYVSGMDEIEKYADALAREVLSMVTFAESLVTKIARAEGISESSENKPLVQELISFLGDAIDKPARRLKSEMELMYNLIADYNPLPAYKKERYIVYQAFQDHPDLIFPIPEPVYSYVPKDVENGLEMDRGDVTVAYYTGRLSDDEDSFEDDDDSYESIEKFKMPEKSFGEKVMDTVERVIEDALDPRCFTKSYTEKSDVDIVKEVKNMGKNILKQAAKGDINKILGKGRKGPGKI